MVFESTVVFTVRQSEERRRDDESVYRASFGRGDEKIIGGLAHLPNRRKWLEKTAQRDHCREKNRRRHARVGDVSRVTDGGLRENETTHRNARNTTAGTSPSPSNPVVGSMRGKGSERGRAFRGRARWRAKARRVDRDARAKERARLDPSASSLRVDVEGFERKIVASTSSTRVWSFACEGAGETRGTRTAVAAEGDRAYGILTRSPIQSVRTSPSPVVAPSADILPDASRVPVANEDASLGLAEPHRWRARGGADRESARAPRTPTRSRSLASARARRKCVVLARLSSARPRVVRAEKEGSARSCSTTNHEGTS